MLNYIATQAERRQLISFFFIILVFVQLTGCEYYRVKQYTQPSAQNASEIFEARKKFIIHLDEDTYEMRYISMVDSTLTGKLYNPGTVYYDGFPNNGRVYQGGILQEVHIYLNQDIPPSSITAGDDINIPLRNIAQIRVLNSDPGTSVLAGVGTIAAIAAVIFIVILLTKTSCPYLYVETENGWNLQGELFPGAQYQNLERTDYLKINDPLLERGSLNIQINNELLEKQWIDLVNLMVVSHEPDVEVFTDQLGNVFTYSAGTPPICAISNSSRELSTILSSSDGRYYSMNDTSSAVNEVILEFENTYASDTAKLLIGAKNTLWAEYILGSTLEKFGEMYQPWMRHQSKKPSIERRQRVSDMQIPMKVYLKSNGNWEFVDEIQTVGPLAYRDILIPLDISSIQEDKIEVKLETGFMLWEIDYAHLDISGNSDFEIHEENYSTMINNYQADWTDEGILDDSRYITQLETGNSIQLQFNIPASRSGGEQSFILRSNGYYEPIRNYAGKPDLQFLLGKRDPAQFPIHSLNTYKELAENDLIYF